MNWRWLVLDFVDPQLNLTIEQRMSVRRQAKYLRCLDRYADDKTGAWFRVLPPPRTSWSMRLLAMFSIALAGAATWRFASLQFVLILAGLLALGWLIYVFFDERRSRYVTLAALCHHGFDVCRTCGYMLRGLGDDVNICPECGAQRMPLPEQIELPETDDLLDKL